MSFDEGQYPPQRKSPPNWDAKRDGYGCSITTACALWLGAKQPTLQLQNRCAMNPSAFIRVTADGATLIWPLDFKAFKR